MERDDFLDDGSLPIYVASVRQIAIMIAVENRTFLGGEAWSKEVERFWDSNPHVWGTMQLSDMGTKVLGSIESLLCRDVERGHIKARQVRRELDGELDVARTLLDLENLEEWAQTYDLDLGDDFNTYCDTELEVARKALNAARMAHARLVDPEGVVEAEKRAQSIIKNEEELTELILENVRLKRRAGADAERDLRPRERNSLLRIIRALSDMAKLPQRGYAESLRAQLAQAGLTVLSDDTIRKAIEDARSLDS